MSLPLTLTLTLTTDPEPNPKPNSNPNPNPNQASFLAEESGAALMLVASEAHLRGQPCPPDTGETSREAFEATAEALGGKHLELSAETGEGVDAFLNTAVRLALQAREARKARAKPRHLSSQSNGSSRASASSAPSRRASEGSSSVLGLEDDLNLPSWVKSLFCARPKAEDPAPVRRAPFSRPNFFDDDAEEQVAQAED